MATFPRSPFDPTQGFFYFARMCDKIRLHAAGELPEAYHEFLGKGFDGRTCGFLRVSYAELRERVLAGASDDEAFAWCQESFGPVEDIHRAVWNGFTSKRGWRDADGGTDTLNRFKTASGFQEREDIQTFFEYYEADEGRA